MVADGPQFVEHENNDISSTMLKSWSYPAEPRVTSDTTGMSTSTVSGPGRVSGSSSSSLAGGSARRIDSVVEVLDGAGRPIPRAVLRPIDQTEVAFRDHPSKVAGNSTHPLGQPGRSMIIFCSDASSVGSRRLPRNPDDDSVFWNQQGQRLGMLETTPEQHPMGQPMYKVEIHPPGTVFPPGGVPPTTLTYVNDDGGPSFSKDSRVTFDAPADGDYLVRVEDVRGLGGERFRLLPGPATARPSFRIALGTENPNIPRGGTTLVPLDVARLDGFDGPIEVRPRICRPGSPRPRP